MSNTATSTTITVPPSWFIAPDAHDDPTIWDGPQFRAVTSRSEVGIEAWAVLAPAIPAAALDGNREVLVDDDGLPIMATEKGCGHPLRLRGGPAREQGRDRCVAEDGGVNE